MPKVLIKPRWQAWENTCLIKAYDSNIQLKIIALALGRTMTSISKKIRELGLRTEAETRGRIRGKKNHAPWFEKSPLDLKKMNEILTSFAPIRFRQKGELALKENNWTFSKPLRLPDVNDGTEICRIEQRASPYSFSSPSDYILSKDHVAPREKKERLFGDPFYVPLHHVQEWALSEGFHLVKEELRRQGVSFWKEGKYFSRTQLLVYINRIRFERKLQPLAVEEDNL